MIPKKRGSKKKRLLAKNNGKRARMREVRSRNTRSGNLK